MKVIILAAGEAARFDGNCLKQHLLVNNERLIDRTIRLASGFVPKTHIVVVTKNKDMVKSSNDGVQVLDPIRNSSTCSTLLSSCQEWGEDTIILFSDVFYSIFAINLIMVGPFTDPIKFFTDGQDIFAFRFKKMMARLVCNSALRVCWDNGKEPRIWELYREMFGLKEHPMKPGVYDAIAFIGDETQDFDTMEDYNNFNNGVSKNALWKSSAKSE